MTPSWYDVLDVEPTATSEQIRDAWRAAIADLAPSDRRFRLANQAAEVLLDPDRRASHDAELADQTSVENAAAAETEATEQVPAAAAEPRAKRRPVLAKPRARSGADAERSTGAVRVVVTSRRGLVPGWLLAGLALLTAVLVGFSSYLYFAVPSDAAVAEATSTAQGVAERAIVPVLSYDYRRLDDDKAAAEAFMTPAYQDTYAKLFTVVANNAPDVEAVVQAEFVASSVVNSGEDRVQVLLFANQTSTNKVQKTPRINRNYVTVTMQYLDGQWLVDDLQTSPVQG